MERQDDHPARGVALDVLALGLETVDPDAADNHQRDALGLERGNHHPGGPAPEEHNHQRDAPGLVLEDGVDDTLAPEVAEWEVKAAVLMDGALNERQELVEKALFLALPVF